MTTFRCPNCDYDLTGQAAAAGAESSLRCPECGRSWSPTALRSAAELPLYSMTRRLWLRCVAAGCVLVFVVWLSRSVSYFDMLGVCGCLAFGFFVRYRTRRWIDAWLGMVGFWTPLWLVMAASWLAGSIDPGSATTVSFVVPMFTVAGAGIGSLPHIGRFPPSDVRP